MNHDHNNLATQDAFVRSLPVGMQQAFFSQKHLDIPEVFSHVLIVDEVDDRVSVEAVLVGAGITRRPGSMPSPEVGLELSEVLRSLRHVEITDEVARGAAEKLRVIMRRARSEKITGEVAVWFFEPGGYFPKELRILDKT